MKKCIMLCLFFLSTSYVMSQSDSLYIRDDNDMFERAYHQLDNPCQEFEFTTDGNGNIQRELNHACRFTISGIVQRSPGGTNPPIPSGLTISLTLRNTTNTWSQTFVSQQSNSFAFEFTNVPGGDNYVVDYVVNGTMPTIKNSFDINYIVGYVNQATTIIPLTPYQVRECNVQPDLLINSADYLLLTGMLYQGTAQPLPHYEVIPATINLLLLPNVLQPITTISFPSLSQDHEAQTWYLNIIGDPYR